MSSLDLICQTVLIVLANTIWQVALVGLVTFAVLRLSRVRSPQWRYGICVGALAAIIACPLLTALTPHTGLRLVQFEWTLTGSDNGSSDLMTPPEPTAPAAVHSDSAAFEPRPIKGIRPINSQPLTPPWPVLAPESPESEPPGTTVGSAPSVHPAIGLPGYVRWWVAVYVLGLVAMLARLSGGQVRLSRLRRLAGVAPAGMSAMLDRLRRMADVGREVHIGISDRIVAPVLIGLLWPK